MSLVLQRFSKIRDVLKEVGLPSHDPRNATFAILVLAEAVYQLAGPKDEAGNLTVRRGIKLMLESDPCSSIIAEDVINILQEEVWPDATRVEFSITAPNKEGFSYAR